jgi:hypothetical protein
MAMGYRKICLVKGTGTDLKNVHLILVKSAPKNIFAQNTDFSGTYKFQFAK